MKKDGHLWSVGFLSYRRTIHRTWVSSTSMPQQRAAHGTKRHLRVTAVLTVHDSPVSSKYYPGHGVGVASSSSQLHISCPAIISLHLQSQVDRSHFSLVKKIGYIIH